MASKLEFVEYICEQLKDVGNIRYRSMMGEYLIYVNDKYVVGICDNQMFLKPTEEVKPMLKEITLMPMYEGAKPSYLINDIDDKDYLVKIVKATYDVLPEPKKKKSKS